MKKIDIREDIKDIPLISVMMCAYNAESYIYDAIESVLAQSYQAHSMPT